MSPNQAIPADKSNHFSQLAAAQPLTILTWPEALHASGSRRACRIPINRGACSLLFSVICRNSPKQLAMVSPELA